MNLKKRLVSVCLAYLVTNNFAWSATEDLADNVTQLSEAEHNTWLKKRFSQQHEQLMPIVAVADMFFSCQQKRQAEQTQYPVSFLVQKMGKQQLAENLSRCLGDDTMQSDMALNFGLLGCFHEQLKHLPAAQLQQKMHLVEQSLVNLSYEERKKSFTKCVNEQSIGYLK
jgi:hypothetical protein